MADDGGTAVLAPARDIRFDWLQDRVCSSLKGVSQEGFQKLLQGEARSAVCCLEATQGGRGRDDHHDQHARSTHSMMVVLQLRCWGPCCCRCSADYPAHHHRYACCRDINHAANSRRADLPAGRRSRASWRTPRPNACLCTQTARMAKTLAL